MPDLYPEILSRVTTVSRGPLEYPLQYVESANGPYGWKIDAVRSVEADDHDDIVCTHKRGDSIESWLAFLWADENVDRDCYSLCDWFRAAQACKYCGMLFNAKTLARLIGFKQRFGHGDKPDSWGVVRSRCDALLHDMEHAP